MNWLLLVAFIAYFVVVIGIGYYFYQRNTKMNSYFLADRQLNPYVVALSAQASDMSGWLLMGLPGAILLAGVGEVWTGIGLAIGTYAAWLIIAKRLRIYSEKAHNSITISEFFSNRFKDEKGLIRVVCGIVILVFFTVYVASAFNAGGKVLTAIFPEQDYTLMLWIGAIIIIIYTFLGGFKAVCWTDFFQGLLMLVAIIIVPMGLMGQLGGFNEAMNAVKAIAEVDPSFSLDMIGCGWIAIISGIAWGLGYMGMPHILVRYMSIDRPEAMKISRRVATVWVVIALGMACILGLVGRAWAESNGLNAPGTSFNAEMIFIYAINDIWSIAVPILAGVLFAALMAAVMSTADSQLLVASSAITNDVYKYYKKNSMQEEKLVWISRGIIIVIAIIAALIAMDENNTIMSLVSFAWAGFGAAFGPLMILALFWKRTNSKGALAGIFTGFATVVLWNTFLRSGIIGSGKYVIDTPVTGVYELLPAFILAFVVIILVSLITKEPGSEMIETFESVEKECGKPTLNEKTTSMMGIVGALVFLVFGHFSTYFGNTTVAANIDSLAVTSGSASVCAFIAVFAAGLFMAIWGLGVWKNEKCLVCCTNGMLIAFAGAFAMGFGLIDCGYDLHVKLQYMFCFAIAFAALLSIIKDRKKGHPVSMGITIILLTATIAQCYAGTFDISNTFMIAFCVAFWAIVQCICGLLDASKHE